MLLSRRGTTLETMVTHGTHVAICDMATRAVAGIVAVNRAQERSYTIQCICQARG